MIRHRASLVVSPLSSFLVLLLLPLGWRRLLSLYVSLLHLCHLNPVYVLPFPLSPTFDSFPFGKGGESQRKRRERKREIIRGAKTDLSTFKDK